MTPKDNPYKPDPRYESGIWICPNCQQKSIHPIVMGIQYKCPNENCPGVLRLKKKYSQINKEEY